MHRTTLEKWRKTGGIRHLEKVLGNFDGQGCLGRVLARLHARLPDGLGWDGGLEKGVGGEVGRVLARLHVRLPDGLDWDWCLEKGVDGEVAESAWKFDGRGCLGKVLGRLHARLPGGLGWAGVAAWKLLRVDARKNCAECSYQEVLGSSSSNNTMAHHQEEAIVVSMGRLKKLVLTTREEMWQYPYQIYISWEAYLLHVQCACTVVVRSPGGGGGGHFATVLGGGGDRLPWGAEGHGGRGYVCVCAFVCVRSNAPSVH